MKLIHLFSTTIAVVSLSALGTAAYAQDYPTRPVHLIVPFSPGGGNDALARDVAPRLSDALGQPVIIENRPGAGGNIGAAYVARNTGDGYTLLMASNQVVINPSLYTDMAFDVIEDLKPVAFIADVQFALVRHPDVDVSSVMDLIEKSKQENLHHGTPGVGTPQHLAAEVFNRSTNSQLTHVPYRGTGPMVTDLLGGQIELSFATLPSVRGFIQEGTLKALGVTGAARSPLLPDVPTIAEEGVEGYDVITWYGILAPAATPDHITQKLETALSEVASLAEFEKAIVDKGFQPRFVPAKEASAIMRSDLKTWETVIKEAGLKLE